MRNVIQGEKETFVIQLTEKEKQPGGGELIKPFDLTGYTEIEVCFKALTVKVSKKQTLAEVSVVGLDTDGKITSSLQVADTDSYSPTNTADIEIVVTKGVGEVTKFQILGAFKVTQKICD